MVSLIIAWTYGILGRSFRVGKRPVPTTLSISTCAFLCTSGYLAIAKTKTCNAA
jgi:hypothetical protein